MKAYTYSTYSKVDTKQAKARHGGQMNERARAREREARSASTVTVYRLEILSACIAFYMYAIESAFIT